MPEIERIGDDIIAVYIADDPTRTSINRTELTFRIYDGTWSNPSPVADDGTADLNPQLASLPNGDVVCIWQDADAVLDDEIGFQDFLSHLEIAVSTYDSVTGTWSAETQLTSNAALDRSPNIAAAASDAMLAVWLSNSSNDLWGSATASNEIMWSVYSGSTWSTPAAIATGLGTILDTTLAYDGTTGTFVYVVDADDDLSTPDDQELWVTTYSGGSWSGPTQLTNDPVIDAAPRLAYDLGGCLRLAWLKGDDIRFTTGTDVENSQVVTTPNESMGSKDFDLVMSDTARIALVWSDISETYHDIWVSYYEPDPYDAWSQPRQLTFDDSSERYLSAVFDTNDDLFCVYGKTHTLYHDQVVDVNGQLVTVENVPEAGPSDLYFLTYSLEVDLSVSVEDVNCNPPNPLPGTDATITATIKNIGEAPAIDIQVAFYDGDPNSGGTLIDTIQTITGPLEGGGEAEVSVTWAVPESIASHDIFIEIDPSLVQTDRDRNNNSTCFRVLYPDLEISEIGIQRAGQDLLVTVRLKNEGSLSVTDAEVKLRNNGHHGPIIATLISSGLVPGAFHDLTYRWESPTPAIVPTFDKPMPGSFNSTSTPSPRQQQLVPPSDAWMLYVFVDETDAIDEFDESNNVKSAVILQKSFGEARQINKNH